MEENKEEKGVEVGLSVIVMKENKVLMGKRKGSHGAGTWSFPGGRQRFGEKACQGALRELKEEVDVEVALIDEEPCESTDDYFKEEKEHYRTLFFRARYVRGYPELSVKEPDKCGGWAWFDWDDLPQPLFLPIVNLLKKGYNPFER